MKNYIIIFSAALILMSCFRDRIEVDLNDENQKIVITAWITDLNEPQFVSVSRTVNYLGDPEDDFVTNAIVVLSVDDESYLLAGGHNGRYYLSEEWEAQLSKSYTLEVEVDGERYSASHVMRPCPAIEAARLEYVDKQEDGDTLRGYETVFSFQETEGEGDAYYVIDYLQGTTIGDSLRNGGFANDQFVDGEYFDDIRAGEDERLYQSGETAVIELYSIGEESANYLSDIESEIFRGGPFDPPPANVRTNFSGGALGYFIISGAQQVELEVP